MQLALLRVLTYGIVWLSWAVVGLLCWIPLLVRATASLSAAILYCTIAQVDPAALKSSFENALTFYPRGFEMIERILSPRFKGPALATPANASERWWRVILEIAWTVLFWGTLFYALTGYVPGLRVVVTPASMTEMASYNQAIGIDKYEVTNAQYAEFLNARGNRSEGDVEWMLIDSGAGI